MAIDLETMIERWRSDLMDLSRRNRLLHFGRQGSSYRRLAHPDLYTVIDELDTDGGGWEIATPGEGLFSAEGEFLPPEEEPALAGRRRRQPRLWLHEPSPATLRKFLTNLRRRANTELGERGVHVLYITAGMLEWRERETEPDTGDVQRSPLVLFPVILQRDSVNDPFVIVPAAEEEISANPALQRKMEHDFDIAIPDLPSPEEADRAEGGELCRNYFAAIREAVARHPTWRVSEEAWLGLFTFQKLVMFADLRDNRERLAECPIIRALAGDHTAVNYPDTIPEEGALDREVAPRDVYHVVDADSSQFRCLEAVRRGASVVLQGPPGTGKSQTITNMIAQAVADGKSVLFVSEKMAALEVVQRRLEQAQLGPFCLELHSHKANKREVVQALHHALGLRLEPGQRVSGEELEALRIRRDRLNEYVEELHRPRAPFQRSAYQVLGELAPLDDIPFIAVEEKGAIRNLDAAGWLAFQDAASKIARRWGAITAGEDFPWHGANPVAWSTQVEASREQELSGLLDALAGARRVSVQLAEALGRTPPDSLPALRRLAGRAEIISQSPGIPEAYHGAAGGELPSILAEGRRLDGEMAQSERLFSYVFKDRIDRPHPGRDAVLRGWEAIGSRLPRNRPAPERLGRLKGLGETLRRLAEACERTRKAEEEFRLHWRLRETEVTPARLRALRGLHGKASRTEDLEPSFLEPAGLTRAEARLRDRAGCLEQAARLHHQLLEAMDPSILELDLRKSLDDLRTRYGGFLRLLKPGYHRLKKAVLGRVHGEAAARTLTEWVEFALAAQQAQRAVEEGMEEDRAALGRFARGRETDIQGVRDALAFARGLFSDLPDRPFSEETRGYLSCGGLLPPDVSRAGGGLTAAVDELEALLEKCALDGNAVLGEANRQVADWAVSGLAEWALATAAEIDALMEEFAPYRSVMASDQREEILNALAAREAWLLQRSELDALALSAAPVLATDWQGRDSDWEEIEGKIVHLSRLSGVIGGAPTERERRLLARRNPGLEELPEARRAEGDLRERLDTLAWHFANGAFRLRGRDVEEASWEPLGEWLRSLRENIICLRDLADIAFARRELASLGFEATIDALLTPAYSREEFPLVARKSVLRAWLDEVAGESPALSGFREDDHQRMLQEFRDLDRRLWHLGPHRVIESRGYTPPAGDAPGGEVAILRQEAAKKRRHMPLRKLFENLPTLIQRLKPCLLMSPLSVSQFLKDSAVTFDLLVFDEASQIRTHDALGAIMRARQVVVCGDSKQLPPTDFFSGSLFEGDDVYDEENDIPEYESVLDACRATNMPETTLRWHYRSRHESLITYSNHGFYNYRLVTFPSSVSESPDLGVQFEHLPDAVYDRGRKRINEEEARRVVDLIVDIWRRHGTTRSMGVVAFSLQQANAILDLLELRMKELDGLEELFDGERTGEPLFVKNLENVQGDERDIILFSICYGPDRDGRMTNNFGPINGSGGERRLNVAVTRARERLVIVSSIRAGDIDVSGSARAGVLHLHKYLDYAERGEKVLEIDSAGRGDPESPLEESIVGFLREKGHAVDSQVGCSGFRIDIGVRHPARPGRFVLGVECDGATYHSSATARDRDRLRQEVLENSFGWRIHRIWGPEWVANRRREEKRLLEAIHEAIENVDEPAPPPPPPVAAQVSIHTEAPSDGEEDALPAWAAPFRAATEADLPARPGEPARWGDILAALARAEEGIHLDRALQLLREFGHISRATAQIKSEVHAAADALAGDFRREAGFLLPAGAPPRVRVNDADSYPGRELQHVPPGELALSMRMLLADNGTMTRDALLTATARLHGIARLGSRIRVTLEDVLDSCLAGETIVAIGERLALPER